MSFGSLLSYALIHIERIQIDKSEKVKTFSFVEILRPMREHGVHIYVNPALRYEYGFVLVLVMQDFTY